MEATSDFETVYFFKKIIIMRNLHYMLPVSPIHIHMEKYVLFRNWPVLSRIHKRAQGMFAKLHLILAPLWTSTTQNEKK
jgi:hypothetical protein